MLVAVASATLSSMYLGTLNTRPVSHEPTATYSEYLHSSQHGELHIIEARPKCRTFSVGCSPQIETVYYLTTDEGHSIRIIFLCLIPPCGVLSEGAQLVEGAHLTAKGTLIVPSLWAATDYLPELYFYGDIHAEEITP